VAILNIQAAQAWIGELLHRSGPVSGRTWRGMVEQGLPVGLIAGSRFVSTDAVMAWLEARAGLPLASAPLPTQTPRRRGRPTKSGR